VKKIKVLSHRLGWMLVLLLMAGAAGAGLPKLPKAPSIPGSSSPAPGQADPKAWLDKVDAFMADVEGARACLDGSRSSLFSLTATAEEKKLLEEAKSGAAERGEDLVLATRRVEDEVLRKAQEEKRLESRKLSGAQLENMSRLGGNLLLAIKRDTRAVAAGKSILEQADDVVKAAGDPATALRLGKDASRIVALPKKLSTTLQEIPAQLSSLQALLEAVEQSRKGNAFQLVEPAEDGEYSAVEEF